jgi:hypothetical protein
LFERSSTLCSGLGDRRCIAAAQHYLAHPECEHIGDGGVVLITEVKFSPDFD